MKRKTNKNRVGAAIAVLLTAVILLTGFYDGPQKLVTETYIVKSGDTLWDISQEFVKKNTGGRRYILEFLQGIREQNPALWESVDLTPGQELKISYWVNAED